MDEKPRLEHRYYELLWVLVRARLASEASKQYLHVLWWVLEPLLSLTVFYLVFGVLLQRGTSNFVDFLLVGVVAWNWFQRTVSNGIQSISSGKGLLLQVYFPKILLPIATVLQDLVKQSFVFLLLLLYLLGASYLQMSWLAFPLIVLLQLVLVAGIAGLVAALVPFLPDLRFVVSTGLQLLMFGSGVFYPLSAIPESLQSLFLANPVATLLHLYREVLLYGNLPALGEMVMLASYGAFFCALAYFLLQRFDARYPRVLTE